MKMKLIILVLSLTISGLTFGQKFKKDWSKFNASSWTAKFISDKSSEDFLIKETQGRLVFKYKSDATQMVTYYVYYKSDMDSSFNKKIIGWLISKSCLTLTNRKTNFASFELGQYYYLLKPCHTCHSATNQDCEFLAEQILTFIKGKDVSH